MKLIMSNFNAKLDGNRHGFTTAKGPYVSADLTKDNGERFTLLCNSSGISQHW